MTAQNHRITLNNGVTMPRHEFDKSLRNLDLDYLDLYLIHQPLGDYYSSWHAVLPAHRRPQLMREHCVQMTPARACSSTTATPPRSAGSAAAASTDIAP